MRGSYQYAGRCHLAEADRVEPADSLPELHELRGRVRIHPRFFGQDLLLDIRWGEVELDSYHSLAGRVFQVLEHALITGVVGDDQAESLCRLQGDSQAVDG